jgi:hypothetical protein
MTLRVYTNSALVYDDYEGDMKAYVGGYGSLSITERTERGEQIRAIYNSDAWKKVEER